MSRGGYNKSYYERNKEKLLNKAKQRYESRKDELRAYQREYKRRVKARQTLSE